MLFFKPMWTCLPTCFTKMRFFERIYFVLFQPGFFARQFTRNVGNHHKIGWWTSKRALLKILTNSVVITKTRGHISLNISNPEVFGVFLTTPFVVGGWLGCKKSAYFNSQPEYPPDNQTLSVPRWKIPLGQRERDIHKWDFIFQKEQRRKKQMDDVPSF